MHFSSITKSPSIAIKANAESRICPVECRIFCHGLQASPHVLNVVLLQPLLQFFLVEVLGLSNGLFSSPSIGRYAQGSPSVCCILPVVSLENKRIFTQEKGHTTEWDPYNLLPVVNDNKRKDKDK